MFEEKMNKIFKKNEPIFIEEILDAIKEYSRAYTFRQIKKMEEDGTIVRFTQGVYYLPTETEFGRSSISIHQILNRKYLNDNDEIFGVYSGLILQNMFGVTTQVPNVLEIVTNKETTRCRKIHIRGREFILRKSRIKITKENASSYMILQLFSEIKDADYMDERGIRTIRSYMKKTNVTKNDLFELANVFPARTMKNLMISGVLNDPTLR